MPPSIIYPVKTSIQKQVQNSLLHLAFEEAGLSKGRIPFKCQNIHRNKQDVYYLESVDKGNLLQSFKR